MTQPRSRSAFRPGRAARRSPRGFSLVELLVVIAILSVLLSILTPSLQRGKYLARRAICVAQTHQQYVAQTTYAAQSNGRFPRHTDHSPEYLRSSHDSDPNDNVIDNMKRSGILDTQITVCPICAVFGHRYADTRIGGDYGGLDAGYPNCLGSYMWLANYDHWNGVIYHNDEPPFPKRFQDCTQSQAFITHRISLLDPYIRDVAHRGMGLYTQPGNFDFHEDSTTVDQPVGYADGHVTVHSRSEIEVRFTLPGVGDYWY